MSPEVRAFVDSYAQNPKRNITISDFFGKRKIDFSEIVKHHNHEIWQECPNCRTETDLRKEDTRFTVLCPDCGSIIFKPKNQ